MSNLMIKDLAKSNEMDYAALRAIVGGLSFGFIQPYMKKVSANSAAPMTLYNVTNNYFDIDYTVLHENATNFYVNNGAGNSGNIINNFDVLSVSAASPSVIGA